MSDFNRYPTAGKMRDVITKIVRSVINSERPRYRYGVVVGVDYDLHKASVIMNGDEDAVRVSIGSTWPSYGEVVRVDGIGTDRYIADVISSGRTAKVLSARSESEFQAIARGVIASPGVPLLVMMTNTTGSPSLRLSDDGISWSSIESTLWGTVWHPATLNVGWSNYGSVYAGASYTKTSTGIVALRGLVIPPAGTNVIFTLPVGYRPAAQMTYNAINGTGKARVDVHPDGRVQAIGVGATNYLSLMIMFPSSDIAPELEWVPLTLANGFVEVSTEQVPGYWQDAEGRVWLRGAVTHPGAPATDAVITSSFADLKPTKRSLFTVQNANAGAYVDITETTGTLRYKIADSVSYIGLSGIVWYPAAYSITALPKATGFTDFSASTPTAGYRLGRDGIVTLDGLLDTPATAPATSAPIVTSVPADAQPSSATRSIHGVASVTGYQRIDTGMTQRIAWGDSANAHPSWITLNGIQYIAGA